MPITSQLLLQKDEKVQKIYATRPAGVDRQQVKETLADLAQKPVGKVGGKENNSCKMILKNVAAQKRL